MNCSLSFVQTRYRARKSLHHRRDLLEAARRTGQGIEALETEQSVEHIDRLVDCLGDRLPMLLTKSLDNDTKALPPPFVTRPYHLLEVRIKCSQGPEPAHHEPIGVPETTEDGDVGVQGIEGVWLAESGSELLHASLSCKGIAQGFQKSNFRAELVVDGHAGDSRPARHRVDAERLGASSGGEQLSGRA